VLSTFYPIYVLHHLLTTDLFSCFLRHRSYYSLKIRLCMISLCTIETKSRVARHHCAEFCFSETVSSSHGLAGSIDLLQGHTDTGLTRDFVIGVSLYVCGMHTSALKKRPGTGEMCDQLLHMEMLSFQSASCVFSFPRHLTSQLIAILFGLLHGR
jgi:hypothetical protein